MLAGALAGCAPPACRVGDAGILAQLYFGRSMHGQPVDRAAWQDFLARSLTPRFPDGFTVLDASGQWRSPATGLVGHEPSTVVVIATDAGAQTASRLAVVRAEYQARFAQESVGLVTSPSCNSF